MGSATTPITPANISMEPNHKIMEAAVLQAEQQPEVVVTPSSPSAAAGAGAGAGMADVELADPAQEKMDQAMAAERFMDTVHRMRETMGTISAQEISFGCRALSSSYQEGGVANFNGFKAYATNELQVKNGWQSFRASLNGGELQKLPACFAQFALSFFFLVVFASVFYPSTYGPPLLSKGRAKLEEWQVREKAAVAAEKAAEGFALLRAKAEEAAEVAKAKIAAARAPAPPAEQMDPSASV